MEKIDGYDPGDMQTRREDVEYGKCQAANKTERTKLSELRDRK